MDEKQQQERELCLKIPAMPADANASGDIFGGWVMAQMDAAAGYYAAKVAHGRVVTAAVEKIVFKRPVKIGDVLAIYASESQIGRTSIRFKIDVWAMRYLTHEIEHVTAAEFVMVAMSKDGKPRPVLAPQ